MTDKPRVENAPGLVWKPRKNGWEARWAARTDLVARGFLPKSQRLWAGVAPTETEAAMISDGCQRLQNEMLVWSRGGVPQLASVSDGTLRGLIHAYQTDALSTYRKLRYHVRVRQDQMLRRVAAKHGDAELAQIKARTILEWHKQWSDDGKKLAVGHFLIAQLRVMCGFGMTILEDEQCERLSVVLSKMRFPSPRPRTERLTADQAVAIRAMAHEFARPSIALAQAFQFDLMLRQKDCIGEWVPMAEPGVSDIFRGNDKWLHGLRWEEIDQNLILRHYTSKKDKPLEVDLNLAPMVMEELSRMAAIDPGKKKGAVIVCETTGRPWISGEYRRHWRLIADAVGIPKSVKNMDSRAGGISEATDAGAELEHVRHAATHSNISMTQRYSRGATEKIANVMQLRAEHRNKKRTTRE